MRKLVLIAVLLLIASSAYAKCTGKIIFACTTTNGKQLEVCDNENAIEYSFGKAGKPEKNIKIDRKLASTYQWNGMGRYMSYSVEIPTGDTVYSVFSSTDKNSGGIERGVNVLVKNKQVTTVKCNEKKKITDNIEGINLKPAE